ncbi:MAG: SMP-30/gluconolactonase/LRE family protein [Pirellulales bacterium]
MSPDRFHPPRFFGAAVLTALAGWLFPALGLGQEVQYPLAIAAREQTLFIVDRNLPGIWKVEDGKRALFFQGSKQLRTPLNAPRSIAVDREGRLLVGDSATREVYRLDADGKAEPLTGGGIGIPMGIAVTDTGDLLVSDLELHCIWKVPAGGGKPQKFADVPAPRGVALDEEGRLWVVSRGDNELVRVTAAAKVETVIKGRAFQFAHDIAIDSQGNVYISDNYAKTIWKLDRAGKPASWASGKPLVGPVGLAWQDDKLFVADPQAKAVFQIDGQGQITAVPAEPAASASAASPDG